ncbi:hypothetical protein ACIRTB_03475 [Streptomyces sp. NPDC101158]|uniref:RCC1 domain-containing protein n=1 Tax=Streptomyces sp. NPDC101158 TaxID=3366117 RepID=UPI0037F5B5E7
MSVKDSRPPGDRRRPAPRRAFRSLARRPLAALAALATGLVTALVLAAPSSPAYADGAGGRRDIRTGPPGTVLTWGSNGFGQLGDGNTTGDSPVPGRVCGNVTCTAPLDKVVQVAAGDGHSIALLDDGTVVGWGNNASGQLGDGTRTSRLTPVHVCAVGEPAPCASVLTDVVAVAVGDIHSFAVLRDGTVVAWGSNAVGRLGDGTFTDRPSPVHVCAPMAVAPCTSYLSHVTRIAAGFQHSLAVRSDGSVVTWGHNGNGQLGNGTLVNWNVPGVINVTGAVSAAAGQFHSVVARADGSVVTFGFGAGLGNGTGGQTTEPVQVCAVGQTAPCASFLTGVKAVAAGDQHSLAVRSDGTVVSWGVNGLGQLGDGTTTARSVPVQVCAPEGCATKLTGVAAVAAGITGHHSVALRSDGTVQAWGNNVSGQLGDGTKVNRLTPVRVCAAGQTAPCGRLLEGVSSIGAGFGHTIAVSRPLADLATSISASPEPVANGGTLTYTIRVHNYGPTSAENVVLTDHLPGSLRYASATPSTGYCDTPPTGTNDTVICHFGTLGRGGAATVTLGVKVRTPVPTTGGAGVSNGVSAQSDTPDPNPGNNAAGLTTPVS